MRHPHGRLKIDEIYVALRLSRGRVFGAGVANRLLMSRCCAFLGATPVS
jgi:hypothetical protein